jgi:hypothetical protein
MPWLEWDTSASITRSVLHFTAEEINGIWGAASSLIPTASGPTAPPSSYISRIDALLSHVFFLISQARFPDPRTADNDQVPINLNLSLGMRSRVSRPFPSQFLGSPIQLCGAFFPLSQIISPFTPSASHLTPLHLVATTIRMTMNAFTPSATAALLHDLAFQLTPQRLRHAFLGIRNVLVTSWVNLRTYDLDFGGGSKVRYAEGTMPYCRWSGAGHGGEWDCSER